MAITFFIREVRPLGGWKRGKAEKSLHGAGA